MGGGPEAERVQSALVFGLTLALTRASGRVLGAQVEGCQDGSCTTLVGTREPSQVEAGSASEQEHHHQHEDGGLQVEVGERQIQGPGVWPANAGALFSLLLGTALVLGSVARARAAEPVRYEVDARVDAGRDDVAFELRVVVRVEAGEELVRLWLYGDRLALAPEALDERSARWIYPGEISLGGFTGLEVVVDEGAVEARLLPVGPGRASGGSDLLVPIAAGPAREIEVRISGSLHVPDRFGRLGRARGELAMFAPWYPLVVGSDAEGREGWAFEVPHRVRVETAAGEVVLVAEGDAPPRAGTQSELEVTTTYVSLFAADVVHRRAVVVGPTTFWMLGGAAEHTPPPDDAEGMEGVEDVLAIDRPALLREVAVDALETTRLLGIPAPTNVTVASVRSRVELAAHAPGAVLISDRLFQIFPLDVVRDFHRRSLLRALFAEIADRLSRDVEPAGDRGWASDLRSVVLLELDELRRAAAAQRPEDLLALFSFHPAIDSLLYAPQIPFEQAYFGAVDDSDPFFDDPVRARAALTGGRRLFECARDALPDENFQRFVARLVRARRSARGALARVVEPEVDSEALLLGWLRYSSRAVNYRLGEVRSEPLPEGGYRHTIEVIRDGAEREEPVEVEVEDGGGRPALVVWDGIGARGEVTVDTVGPRGTVTLDPHHRLPQSAEVADGHPRADDATSQPFRLPILSAFALDLLVSEGDFTGLVDFAIRQRYDLEHTVSIRLSRTVARTGGRIRYIQGLGPKVHTNRRLGALGGGIGVQYVEPGFGGSMLGGWALDLEVSGSIDSRSYIYDPRGGYSLAGGAQVTGTLREDGTLNLGGRGAVRAGIVLPVGLLNAFAVVVGGGFTVGPALNADLQSLGGRNVLRGFANDELLGSGVVYGVIEHRITALSDLAINVLHLAWVREMQLAWWVGAGGAFQTTDGREAVFALEAGAGVRFHYEYGGIQPGVLSLDVGLPLSRYWDPVANDRVPVGFYVSFDQYY